MTDLVNSFDGVTPSGTAITGGPGNSGGASGNALNAVNLGTGAALTSDSAHAHSGALSCHVTTGVAAQADMTWSTSLGTVSQVWFRTHIYFTANPAALNHICCFTTTGGAAQNISVRVTTTGTIRVEDANYATITGMTTTNSIALNQWVRVEGFVIGSATVGQAELKLFNTTDSATPTETKTSTAVQNTGGLVSVANFGSTPNTASVGYWMDDIGLSTTGYLGPLVSGTDTAPNYAGTGTDLGGGSGSWANPSYAAGTGTGTFATWTVP